MNIREGTRRLALVVGVIGALAGLYPSFLMAPDLLRQRESHNLFQKLVSSTSVRNDVAMLEKLRATPPGYGMIATEFGEKARNQDHIAKINYGRSDDGVHMRVDSIEMEDGSTVYNIAYPSTWLILICLGFPFLGFLLPWGIVMAIGWIVSGFAQAPKSH
jgi:hypothetical protein